uniref:Replication protein A 70 kDa DNA-binding subunit B/D first OB fold domain-containing protein n=1 Tax=Noccaea caerulescens TaxID=107243 RepID=A0A1J3E383_NOCCA
MARVVKLSTVTPNRDDWTIFVKVSKRWDTLDVENGEGLSFLFIDDEGTKIHAFVEKDDQIRRFKRLLQEGDWKTISALSVKVVETEIRLTKQRKVIALTSNTQVAEADDLDSFIPLDLIPFKDVKDESVHDGTSYPRDFLGVIASVKNYDLSEDPTLPRNIWNTSPKTTPKIDFVLEDNDGNVLNCRAKGALAVKFKNYWLNFGQTGTLICLLTDWRVVGTDGEIQVEDAGGISTFEIDPTGHEEVEHFTNILCHVYEDSEEGEDYQWMF